MNSAVNQAFERMKVNAIEKILSDGRTLAVQAAATAEVLSHFAKVQEEFRRHFEVVKFTVPRAERKISKLQDELDSVWNAEDTIDDMEIMVRSELVKKLTGAHGYNIRTAWRRINDMLLAGLIFKNGDFVEREPKPEQENPLR